MHAQDANDSNLVRRQYLMSKDNLRKIDRLRQRDVNRLSAAEIVRRAVEAYDPDAISTQEAEAEAALAAMAKAIEETRRDLAGVRTRVRASLDPQARAAERERMRQEARAHLAKHPEELEALAQLLGGEA